MLTDQEKIAIQAWKENGGNQSAAMRTAGYAETYCRHTQFWRRPAIMMETKRWELKMAADRDATKEQLIDSLKLALFADRTAVLLGGRINVDVFDDYPELKFVVNNVVFDKSGRLIGYDLMSREAIIDRLMKLQGLGQPERVEHTHTHIDELLKARARK